MQAERLKRLQGHLNDMYTSLGSAITIVNQLVSEQEYCEQNERQDANKNEAPAAGSIGPGQAADRKYRRRRNPLAGLP